MGVPSRRAAAIVLAAALVTGATAGVSAAVANLRVPGLMAAPPSSTPSSTPDTVRTVPPSPARSPSPLATTPARTPTPERKPSTVPEPSTKPTKPIETTEPDPEPELPSDYEWIKFRVPDILEGEGGGSIVEAVVPADWTAVDKAVGVRDSRDPTDNLNVRISKATFGDSASAAASKGRAERQKANGYTELGWREFTYDRYGKPAKGIEFRFSSAGSKGTRFGIERYLQGGEGMIGGYYWTGQFELIEPVVARGVASFAVSRYVGE